MKIENCKLKILLPPIKIMLYALLIMHYFSYFCTMIIGYEAKRIVRNGTGLGSYGRTLVNDIARHQEVSLRLYACATRSSRTPT